MDCTIELTGAAYAVVDGIDGRTHHLRFADLDMTGDSQPGSIVELRSWSDAKGAPRVSLTTRSDLPIERQITAPGATWLDRQLVAKEPVIVGGGFGKAVERLWPGVSIISRVMDWRGGRDNPLCSRAT